MSARLNHGSWLARTIGAADLNGTVFLELQSVVENSCSVEFGWTDHGCQDRLAEYWNIVGRHGEERFDS